MTQEEAKYILEHAVLSWSVSGSDASEAIQTAIEALKRKRGEWIEENRRPKSMMFYCSVCHRTAYDPQNHRGGRKRCRYAYCPNCGADMRKGEEE